MEALTVKEALAQGYISCGKESLEWQSLTDIVDLHPGDFEETKYVLFDPEAKYLSVDADQIKDHVLDVLSDQESEIGCDTDFSLHVLREFDWQSVADQINEKLKSAPYYTLTDIKLVP